MFYKLRPRYSDEQIAAHLIGYVNKQDTSGAAGLELMYDQQAFRSESTYLCGCGCEG